MTMTINGTSGLVFNDASTQNTAATGFGFKNRILNGSMVLDQRNAGASVTPTVSGTYTLDRWRVGITQSSKFSVQQVSTAPTGFINSALITSTSAYSVVSGDQFNFSQYIEGFNTSDLGWGTANAQPVTLSFWVRSSLTGTFGGSFRNNANNRSYPFSYTISAANTWEQKSITIAGDTTGTWLTNNGAGIYLTFSMGAGSTYSGTAGAWAGANYGSATGAVSVVGTNGATFYITGVMLEKGSTATNYDVRPYGTELALCQRYYEIGSARIATYALAGANQIGWCSFAVNKRIAPTMTQTFSGSNSSSYGTTTININGFAPFSTATANGQANCSGSWTADSEL
jgi:hypothetical protein